MRDSERGAVRTKRRGDTPTRPVPRKFVVQPGAGGSRRPPGAVTVPSAGRTSPSSTLESVAHRARRPFGAAGTRGRVGRTGRLNRDKDRRSPADPSLRRGARTAPAACRADAGDQSNTGIAHACHAPRKPMPMRRAVHAGQEQDIVSARCMLWTTRRGWPDGLTNDCGGTHGKAPRCRCECDRRCARVVEIVERAAQRHPTSVELRVLVQRDLGSGCGRRRECTEYANQHRRAPKLHVVPRCRRVPTDAGRVYVRPVARRATPPRLARSSRYAKMRVVCRRVAQLVRAPP